METSFHTQKCEKQGTLNSSVRHEDKECIWGKGRLCYWEGTGRNAPGMLTMFSFLLWKVVKNQSVSHSSPVQFFVTPWTVAHQAPLFKEFSRQEYWSGLPFPFPGDLPDQQIEPGSPALQVDSLLSEPPGKLQLFSLWYILDVYFSFMHFSVCVLYFIIK